MIPPPREQLSWYLERLLAMSPTEILLRIRARTRTFADRRVDEADLLRRIDGLPPPASYPHVPEVDQISPDLRQALKTELPDLLSGKWTFFRHQPVSVDLPPVWHKDYLANLDLLTHARGFELDHRRLPDRADIKCIWEISRWQHLTRIALTSHVLKDHDAALAVTRILSDWIEKNPPFRGWNWTSPLEAGMRLIQFAWIDALLAPMPEADGLSDLRLQILVPHVYYTWRHRTFGSSANNHLLGELAGLAMSTARWPKLSDVCAPIERIHAEWEASVLGQFAPDGGNREQALNYQLYSLELCLHTASAFESAGIAISKEVRDRLRRASAAYCQLQSPTEAWDYGDSDDAYVLPFFVSEAGMQAEWMRWLSGEAIHPVLQLPFDPASPPDIAALPTTWKILPDSGYATFRNDSLFLRLDASPLGFLKTAAHGHCDALHLSAWYAGKALLIDPGTCAYYADPRIRAELASWNSHNGPRPDSRSRPVRRGPFLWAQHHPAPSLVAPEDGMVAASIREETGEPTRRSVRVESANTWSVEDSAASSFSIVWQFAPGGDLRQTADRSFDYKRENVSLSITIESSSDHRLSLAERTCSPGFRARSSGPALAVRISSRGSCACRATFVASEVS